MSIDKILLRLSLNRLKLFNNAEANFVILEIWKLSLPGCRTIMMDAFYNYSGDAHSLVELNLAQQTPAMLHTSKEARHIALKVYKKLTVHSTPQDSISRDLEISNPPCQDSGSEVSESAKSQTLLENKAPRIVSYLFVDPSRDTLFSRHGPYNDIRWRSLMLDSDFGRNDFKEIYKRAFGCTVYVSTGARLYF